MNSVPVITLDGPSACGKGTISLLLAEHLQWHFLDSGALYRAAGWAVLEYAVEPSDHEAVVELVKRIDIEMHSPGPGQAAEFHCDGQDITTTLRGEAVGEMASKIGVIPAVRIALQGKMEAMRRNPGLVADGRDMGSVVFPDAIVKFFLNAEVEARAQRRFEQLQRRGISVSLRSIRTEMEQRDARDRDREVAPAKPDADMVLIDTTEMDIDQVLATVISHAEMALAAL